MELYVATFPNSGIVRVESYGVGEPGPEGTIKVATFTLCGREFMCSDSPVTHKFSFTPSSSTFVDFDSKDEAERVFRALATGGTVLMPLGNYGFSSHFGWISDRFGVSWQLNVAA